MSVGLALGCCGSSIKTKADAIKFAVEMTATRKEDYSQVLNKDAAQEVFNFFCENVELVDSGVVPIAEILDPFFNKVKEVIEAEKKCQCRCKNGD